MNRALLAAAFLTLGLWAGDASAQSALDAARRLNAMPIAQAKADLMLRKRLELDLAAVRQAVQNVPDNGKLQDELSAIGQEIPNVRAPDVENFRAILPLNELHERIFAVQAAVWRARGLKDVLVWQKNRWDMLGHTETPTTGAARIDVSMMSNEFRSAAFNLSNAGTEARTVRMKLTGSSGEAFPACVEVATVPFTDTSALVPVASAIVPAASSDGIYSVVLKPGLTAQVWLTFNPRDVAPGTYDGWVVLLDSPHKVPVRFHLYPLKFPEQPALRLYGWDYSGFKHAYAVTAQNRKAVIELLRQHFVSSPWSEPAVMGAGSFDQLGNMIGKPSTRELDEWVRNWPGARDYCVAAAVGPRFAGLDMGTPAFERAVGNWITFWVKEFDKRNIRPEQMKLLLVDEPRSSAQDSIVIEYARAIGRAQPRVVIWEDPAWPDPAQATPELYQVCDVLCPCLAGSWIGDRAVREFYQRQQAGGKELWFYSCSGPARLLDPYSYYRLQQWFCWKYGAQGSGFWSFADAGNWDSSWNEYAAPGLCFTPLFVDRDSVLTSKHMEAIREGMEDYEYLRLLRDRLAELAAKGAQGPELDAARGLLATAADRVLGDLRQYQALLWNTPKDRSVADAVRLEILEALSALNRQ